MNLLLLAVATIFSSHVKAVTLGYEEEIFSRIWDQPSESPESMKFKEMQPGEAQPSKDRKDVMLRPRNDLSDKHSAEMKKSLTDKNLEILRP